MRLYEYEGKELFKKMGIPVPNSECAGNEQEALQAAKRIGFPVVVKAQVLMGGRGKAGLIKKVENDEALLAAAEAILSRIGADEKLLIEECVTAISEGYIGITVDDVKGVPVLVVTAEGGMDVEKTAATKSAPIEKTDIDPQKGLYYHQVIAAIKKAGYRGIIVRELADFTYKLYKVFMENEADTAEINPVFFLNDNKLMAGDAKVIIDDDAVFRNPDINKFKQKRMDPESNTKAIYVPLDGDIGIISLGASNTMMLIDSIKCLGGRPANFADIANGVDRETVFELTRVILEQSQGKVRVILINITLAGASLKVVIEGIVGAIKAIGSAIPMVANIRATGAARADMEIDAAVTELQKVGVLYCATFEGAIDKVIAMSKMELGAVNK